MELGKKAKTARSCIVNMFSCPVLSVGQVAEKCSVGYPAANRLVSDLEKLGILKEVTGHSRNRLFALKEYLDLFRT